MVLVLIALPFGFVLIWGISYYYLYDYLETNSGDFISQLTQPQTWVQLGILFAALAPVAVTKYYFDDKGYSDPETIPPHLEETAVNDLQHIAIIFYILIFAIVGIAIFLIFIGGKIFGVEWLPGLIFLPPAASTTLSYVLVILALVVLFMGGGFLKKDFQYYIAKMSVHVSDETDDGNKKIRFLGIALNSYNEFIERNLQLEFDTAKVFSVILTHDKTEKIKELIESFKSEDKFKPITPLSEIGLSQNSEQFLVKKRIWTSIKEVGTFLAVIIPVLIAVLQLIIPFLVSKFLPT